MSQPTGQDVPDELLIAGLAAYFDGGERLEDFDPDAVGSFREFLAAVLAVQAAYENDVARGER